MLLYFITSTSQSSFISEVKLAIGLEMVNVSSVVVKQYLARLLLRQIGSFVAADFTPGDARLFCYFRYYECLYAVSKGFD